MSAVEPYRQEISAARLEHLANLYCKLVTEPTLKNNPERTLVAMVTVKSLGLDPHNLILDNQVYFVNGRPELMAQLQITAARLHGVDIEPVKGKYSAESVTVKIRKPGDIDWHEVEFTWADAEKAGLPAQNPTYKKFPDRMLFNRAVTKAVAQYTPWVKFGLPPVDPPTGAATGPVAAIRQAPGPVETDATATTSSSPNAVAEEAGEGVVAPSPSPVVQPPLGELEEDIGRPF